jgi:hypothetical protein
VLLTDQKLRPVQRKHSSSSPPVLFELSYFKGIPRLIRRKPAETIESDILFGRLAQQKESALAISLGNFTQNSQFNRHRIGEAQIPFYR